MHGGDVLPLQNLPTLRVRREGEQAGWRRVSDNDRFASSLTVALPTPKIPDAVANTRAWGAATSSPGASISATIFRYTSGWVVGEKASMHEAAGYALADADLFAALDEQYSAGSAMLQLRNHLDVRVSTSLSTLPERCTAAFAVFFWVAWLHPRLSLSYKTTYGKATTPGALSVDLLDEPMPDLPEGYLQLDCGNPRWRPLPRRASRMETRPRSRPSLSSDSLDKATPSTNTAAPSRTDLSLIAFWTRRKPRP